MSMRRLKNRSRTKKLRLEEQVEVISEQNQSVDSEDQDVMQYVEQFLFSYSQIPPLEPTSLLTQEDAQHALQVINEAQDRVQGHLKTAKALKSLLKAKKTEEN